jgi:hypothetical protein
MPKVNSSQNSNTSGGSYFFESYFGSTGPNDSMFIKYGTGFMSNYKKYSFLVPKDGQIKNLIAFPTDKSVEIGSTVTISVFINGKPTALNLSFTNADGFIQKINTTTVISVKQGDLIGFQYKANGSVAPGTWFQSSVELAINSNKNEFTHYVGELYGGGIVVSVWKDTSGEHGLITSLKDLSSGVEWSNLSTDTIGISARSPIDGASNTNTIINQVGHTSSAAQLCNSYSMGGFKDWYLPSIIELKTCESAFYIVNMILGSNDGFKHGSYYWSSTESNLGSSSVYYANVVHFGVPGGYSSPKNFNCRVRAVRRF